jgi:branched-chain amino acid transport system substrate-binding protein
MGSALEETVAFAVDDLNRAGGVVGERVRLISVDDFCDGEQAVAAGRALVAAGVVVDVGHICSGAAIPASDVYAEQGIPMITTNATNPRLTERGLGNVFRVCGRDDVQGGLIANYLAERATTGGIAIVHDVRPGGQGLADEVHRRLTTRDITPVLLATVEPGQVDFGPLVSRLQSSGAGTVLFSGYPDEGGLLVRTSREAGFQGAFVGMDGLRNEAFWLTAGEAAEGFVFTYYPTRADEPMAQQLVQRLRMIDADLPNTFVTTATRPFRSGSRPPVALGVPRRIGSSRRCARGHSTPCWAGSAPTPKAMLRGSKRSAGTAGLEVRSSASTRRSSRRTAQPALVTRT